MSCIQELLNGISKEVEGKVGPWLIFIRSYLPQNWVFKTEKETMTFTVGRDGKAVISSLASNEPDVVIEWTHDMLCLALKTRDRKAIPPGEKPKINIFSKKGEAAFKFLRQTFGFQKS